MDVWHHSGWGWLFLVRGAASAAAGLALGGTLALHLQRATHSSRSTGVSIVNVVLLWSWLFLVRDAAADAAGLALGRWHSYSTVGILHARHWGIVIVGKFQTRLTLHPCRATLSSRRTAGSNGKVALALALVIVGHFYNIMDVI